MQSHPPSTPIARTPGSSLLFVGLLLVLALAGSGVGYGFAVAVNFVATLGANKGNVAKADHADKENATAHAAAAAAPEFAPLFVDWPEQKPDVVLVLTGEMYGYMRPCGCSPGQHGGLARRGGFVDFLKSDRKWNVVPLDLGDLIEKAGPLENLRYTHTLQSLKAIDYPAVGIGPKDLSIGVITILGEALNSEPLKLAGANLDSKDEAYAPLIEEAIKSMVVVEAGDHKVAVASLMANSTQDQIPDQTVQLKAADQVAEKLLPEMEKSGAELKVLLAQMSEDEAKAFAEKRPGFDLILCQSRIEDSATQEAKMVGQTMVTWVGRKGKSAGVVGYWKEGTPKLRFELAPLDTRFKEKQELNDIYAKFVSSVKDGGFLTSHPKVAHPSGDQFVGAQACAKCHQKIYDHWKTTPHAHALETLQTKAVPAGQDFNPECVRCHVVGYDNTSGFLSAQQTLNLAGVQCESCHGPGKRHSEFEQQIKDSLATPKDTGVKEAREALKRSRFTVKSQCVECHNAENSIHFNFDTYWPKVEHPRQN